MEGQYQVVCTLSPIVLPGWVTPCRVQPVIFVLLKLSRFLKMKEPCSCNAHRGCSSICACSCRRRGLSSSGKGLQEPAEQQELELQWTAETGADLFYLLWKHTGCKQVPWALRWHCWAHAREDMSKTSGVSQGRQITSCHKKHTAPRHCRASGWSHRTPLSTAPPQLGSFTPRDPALGQVTHGHQSKGFVLSLSSSSSPIARTSGLYQFHLLTPVFLEDLRNGLCAHVSIGACVYRFMCL